MTGPTTIYTIGHSDHSTQEFIDLLRQQKIETVVDVRSQPFSRWMPQFNRELLALELEQAGLTYVFMGDRLGGRPTDPSLYNGGSERPDYDRMAKAPVFQGGLNRLIELARESTVVVMCSEGDYQQCHRSMLITPELLDRQVSVMHILPDGRAVKAERLLKQLGLF
ncbi:MAG: DUF488 domain-containing protein [Anaerolineales bacterium]|nr:DUF488 domain-containing protein [Anaerolineales bacterium]